MNEERKSTGAMGAEPPPDAPRETSQPLTAEARREMSKKARANEKELAPLTFPKAQQIAPPAEVLTVEPSKATPSPPVSRLRPVTPISMPSSPLPASRPDTTSEGAAAGSAVDSKTTLSPVPSSDEAASPDLDGWGDPTTQELEAADAAVAPAVAAEPDPQDDPVTARPTRGQPKPIADPGKKITGGFGLAEGEATYFALDGNEVAEVARGLFRQISDILKNDLRFSLALTYPRVKVTAVLEVDGMGAEQGIAVRRVATHEPVPMEIARALADEVCFVVRAGVAEQDEAGNPDVAPNQMRQDVGLEVPRKQVVTDAGGGRHWIDRPTTVK